MKLAEYNSYVDQCLRTESQINSLFFSNIAPQLLTESNIYIQPENKSSMDRIGVDMLMMHDNRITYGDIKAHNAGNLIERRCDIALELETCYTRNLRNRYPGWFVSDKKVTDTYAFLLWSSNGSIINDMRVRIFYRSDAINLLRSIGIDVYRWREYTSSIPYTTKNKKYWYLQNGIRIVESLAYPERPINLVIPWQVLSPIFIVDRDYHLGVTGLCIA